jgi:multidrug transporter EmrE-like cation transporter
MTFALVMISLGISLGLLGDVFLKQSGGVADWRLVLGTLLYSVAAIPVWIAYKHASFTWIAIAWQALSLSVSVLIGVTVFRESLTPKRLAALAFALAAVVLLQTEKTPEIWDAHPRAEPNAAGNDQTRGPVSEDHESPNQKR